MEKFLSFCKIFKPNNAEHFIQITVKFVSCEVYKLGPQNESFNSFAVPSLKIGNFQLT